MRVRCLTDLKELTAKTDAEILKYQRENKRLRSSLTSSKVDQNPCTASQRITQTAVHGPEEGEKAGDMDLSCR